MRLFAACYPEDEAIGVALDDTVTPGKGPDVYGLSSHVDAVRSTRRHRAFCFGLCFVVLAVVVKVPFSNRAWALPVLFRLYISKSVCQKMGFAYRKKTELAREMLALFATWFPGRRIEASLDCAYANATVAKDLPKNVVLFSRMRPDAVLTSPDVPVGGRGRPRKYGERLPTPEQRARDKSYPWDTDRMRLYGREQTVRFKTLRACWRRAFGDRLLSIVLVEVPTGKVNLQVFFSTDATLSADPKRAARAILPRYARRWSIEQAFRDLKQHLGFGDSSARLPNAVRRTNPFVGLTFTVLVLWFAEYAVDAAKVPFRPWYRHKRNLSFEDILRTARAVLRPTAPFLVEACQNHNLHQSRPPNVRTLPGSSASPAKACYVRPP